MQPPELLRGAPPDSRSGVLKRDDPALAVERFRRPAAELGPNWLEITTGRARTDEEEVGGAQEEGEGC